MPHSPNTAKETALVNRCKSSTRINKSTWAATREKARPLRYLLRAVDMRRSHTWQRWLAVAFPLVSGTPSSGLLTLAHCLPVIASCAASARFWGSRTLGFPCSKPEASKEAARSNICNGARSPCARVLALQTAHCTLSAAVR